MISHKEVEKYVLSMPNTRLEYPFGDEVAVYKVFIPKSFSATHFDAAQGGSEDSKGAVRAGTVSADRSDNAAMDKEQQRVTSSAREQAGVVRGDWKMFALIAEGKDPVKISLKCDPLLAKVLREKYDEVQAGFHLNKKHWNTIVLSGQLPWEEIQGLIRHSYDLVIGDHNAQTPNYS